MIIGNMAENSLSFTKGEGTALTSIVSKIIKSGEKDDRQKKNTTIEAGCTHTGR